MLQFTTGDWHIWVEYGLVCCKMRYGRPAGHALSRCGMCSDKENETEGVPGDVEDECDEVCIDFDPYTFIKNLPPLKHVVPRWRRSLLPRQTRQCKRKTLVSCFFNPYKAVFTLS